MLCQTVLLWCNVQGCNALCFALPVVSRCCASTQLACWGHCALSFTVLCCAVLGHVMDCVLSCMTPMPCPQEPTAIYPSTWILTPSLHNLPATPAPPPSWTPYRFCCCVLQYLSLLLAAPDTRLVLAALHTLVSFVRKGSHSSTLRWAAKEELSARLRALAQGWGLRDEGLGMVDCACGREQGVQVGEGVGGVHGAWVTKCRCQGQEGVCTLASRGMQEHMLYTGTWGDARAYSPE